MTTDRKLFVLFKQDAALKPEKLYLFQSAYRTDLSQNILESDMTYGLADFIKQQVTIYEKEIPYSYWEYVPKSFFIDTWTVPEVFNDEKSFADIKTWLITIVTGWANTNGFKYQILFDKAGEYTLKFIIYIPLILPVPSETVPS